MKSILVAGAAGEAGDAVVRALAARGARVRALVHTAPVRVAGVESVRGDLADPASIRRALLDCDRACFLTPHHVTEARLGHNFLDACEAAQLRRVVYIAAYRPLARSRILQRVLDGVLGMIGPHYKAKLAIARRTAAASALSPVVLCPTNFYQNDELALPEILAGTYPNPLGRRAVNRVDTRDIGDAAARALLDHDAIAAGTYPLVGPDAWNGERCAAVWSDTLGTPVRYAGDDLACWRDTVGARMPDAKRADFARTYRVIQRFGVRTGPRALAQTTALLGHPPRDFPSYVRECFTGFQQRSLGAL